ncbi:DUF2239 family protein [Pararobbsia silviterrae]|uniref:DUF2239 family protein n=1 Tax=Pararobbsia silviterrae TaxID=1792498 RepID=A0A494Y8M5_9BURK|nr:DUF2239 family protein [Pararobbsia silviterrae]RKP59042.1 DUF2239 family protein [Pararobbsia silviterrae]
MSRAAPTPYTVFKDHRRFASGPLARVAVEIHRAAEALGDATVLIFDDTTGRAIDVDLSGTEAEIHARYASQDEDEPSAGDASDRGAEPGAPSSDEAGTGPKAELNAGPNAPPNSEAGAEPRGRGRPKLGVVAREVTLLPRHWAWLAAQPGGASVALRKLVEEARRAREADDARRAAKDRAYHFMSAIAGDLPGFEEAIRALYADDRARMDALIVDWPDDIRDHARALADVRLPDGTRRDEPA